MQIKISSSKTEYLGTNCNTIAHASGSAQAYVSEHLLERSFEEEEKMGRGGGTKNLFNFFSSTLLKFERRRNKFGDFNGFFFKEGGQGWESYYPQNWKVLGH